MLEDQPRSVALVGHCGPDSFALKSSVMGFIPNSKVEMIRSLKDFQSRISQFDLHLVNRVLDGHFPNNSGIELIRAHHEGNPPMMLISNFPDSLQDAVNAGGVMGFGKRTMRTEQARLALNNALGISGQQH